MYQYAWASIGDHCRNWGNRIIEQCAWYVMRHLCRPKVTINPFVSIDPKQLVGCDFVVHGGATVLDAKDSPGMYDLGIPLVVVGGALGSGRPTDYLCDDATEWDDRMVKRVEKPIAVRDSLTARRVTGRGVGVVLVGCPTLFCREVFGPMGDREPYIAVSLGRGPLWRRADVAIKIATKYQWKICVVAHEYSQIDKGKELFGDVRIVGEADPKKMIECYARASLTVTGRIHGAIPSLCYGTPTYYYESLKHDSRDQLLRDCGVKIYQVEDIWPEDGHGGWDVSKVDALKKAMMEWSRHACDKWKREK